MKTRHSIFAITFLLLTALAGCHKGSDEDNQPADPSQSQQVWFTPNVGSLDMIDLFTAPSQWATARSNIEVFKFYASQLVADVPGGRSGQNVLPNFVSVQAFSQLKQWGIDIAIESGGPMPIDDNNVPCTSARKKAAVRQAFNWIADAIENVQSNGGVVSYISLDGPIRRWHSKSFPDSGGPPCKTSNLGDIAAIVTDYINTVQSVYPSIIIGQIIAYPVITVDEIKRYVIEMENLGISLPFIHLDVVGPLITDYSTNGIITLNQVRADLQDLESFLNAHGIAFAPILIDLIWNTQEWPPRQQYDDKTYYDGTIDWINQVKSAIGKPEHSLFQSWVEPYGEDIVIFPINLPENDPSIYSHTRLLNEGLDLLRGK